MTLAILGIADRTANYVHRWEGGGVRGSSVRNVRGFLRRVPSFKRLAAPDQIRCLVRWNVDDETLLGFVPISLVNEGDEILKNQGEGRLGIPTEMIISSSRR